MSQYQTGTVDVTYNSQSVTGIGTLWLANVSIGDLFMVRGINTHYEVASIPTNTSLTLNSVWAGSTLTGQDYEITRDFTTNYDLIEICVGDKDWPFHMTKNFRDIDSLILAATSMDYTVEDHTDETTVTLTTSDFMPIIHLCSTATLKCTVYLPSIDSNHLGKRIRIRKAGAGEVEINGADSDTIMDTNTKVKNAYTTETAAFIELYVETASHWGCGGLLGRWETTT